MAKMSGNPFLEFDPSKLMGDLKMPGLDVESIIASQRKNIEAVTAANQLAYEGFQAVLRRQAEVLRTVTEDVNRAVGELTVAGTPEEKAAKQADLVKTAFERSLANIRELTEMVAKSNTEAADILAKRVSESLDEIKVAIAKVQK
ncbi:phasin family protein [Azospirillum picis]|uniref:Phasin family protein n=1 Tax=Azospirillum picis TaxID=488438 RepID=A0ABU0MFT7_9PROT|nr:phasin family protein [Azospirillum picis]MBP2298661.1 phasin family protein [Azospirillum picis]MDQ0532290.1 phasin family protein [Azospirillum picis]